MSQASGSENGSERDLETLSENDFGNGFQQDSYASASTSPSPVKETPEGSPVQRHSRGITEAQKQVLLENLELELAERSRRLRAQYELQAQALRTRMEIRINRIPHRLRKMTMGELYDKFFAQDHHAPDAILPGMVAPDPVIASEKQQFVDAILGVATSGPAPEPTVTPTPAPASAPRRTSKRKSDDIDEKENDKIQSPKKRTKAEPIRPASRTKKTTTPLAETQNTSNRPASTTTSRPNTAMGPPPPPKAAKKQTAVPPPAPRVTRSRTSDASATSAVSAASGSATDTSSRKTIARKPIAVKKGPVVKKEPVKKSAAGSIREMAGAKKTAVVAAVAAATKAGPATGTAKRALRSKK